MKHSQNLQIKSAFFIAVLLFLGCGSSHSPSSASADSLSNESYLKVTEMNLNPEYPYGLDILSDGSVFGWGIGTSGQTQVPNDVINAVKVAGGFTN